MQDEEIARRQQELENERVSKEAWRKIQEDKVRSDSESRPSSSFLASKDSHDLLSGSSEIGNGGTWAAAPKTARAGLLRGAERQSLQITQRFAETKPQFKSGVYGSLRDCIDPAQSATFVRQR